MGEQQVWPEGLNSMNSTRVWSGSKRLSWILPSRPICVLEQEASVQPLRASAATTSAMCSVPRET